MWFGLSSFLAFFLTSYAFSQQIVRIPLGAVLGGAVFEQQDFIGNRCVQGTESEENIDPIDTYFRKHHINHYFRLNCQSLIR